MCSRNGPMWPSGEGLPPAADETGRTKQNGGIYNGKFEYYVQKLCTPRNRL